MRAHLASHSRTKQPNKPLVRKDELHEINAEAIIIENVLETDLPQAIIQHNEQNQPFDIENTEAKELQLEQYFENKSVY